MSPGPWAWLGSGGGETAEVIRRVDWTSTAVGHVDSWSVSLKSVVSMMLHARQPMFLWWGSELIQFYNDGYVPSFGVGRHPSAMGQRGRECWAEIWDTIGPEIEGVQRGVATFHEDALVPIFRNGRMEEVYWTYGYSPVHESDGTIAGVLVVVTETTSRVVSVRRLRTAQHLAELLGVCKHASDLTRAVMQALAATPEDSPWALALRTDGDAGVRIPVASSGLDVARTAAILSRLQDLDRRPSDDVMTVLDLAGVAGLPGTPWPEESTQAVALPLRAGPTSPKFGELVIGLSPRLPYDSDYREHALGLGRQLTSAAQRIRSQDERAAAEGARQNLLLQAPFAAALLVGPRWRYELANDLYVRMVGREVVGRDWADCFPELRGSQVQAILRRVYETGEPFFANEQLVPLARESDHAVEERFFDFNTVPIRSQGDVVDALMVVAVEMTARVQARRDLERTAAEREKLVQELEQSARAKDDFLAILGHELRNPLSPISTATRLMRLRGKEGPELDIIERQASHLVRLVDDLMDISRITQGKIELRKTRLELASAVLQGIELAAPLLEQRQQRLDLQVPLEGLVVEGDIDRLAQVVSNLLTNAAKYSEPGSQIHITASRGGSAALLRVVDHGMGIAPEMLSHIFERFVQQRQALDRSQGGVGLGLSIVRSLVQLHGGTVDARSEGLGKGSEFVIELPLARGTEELDRVPTHKDLKPVQSVTSSVGRKRVLIVDDNEDAAEALADLLVELGHEVRVAHDGPTALQVARSLKPNVCLLDIGLPVMDGYDLARRLRRAEGLPDEVRLVAVTGYGQEADRQRSKEAGFNDHLVKPVDFDVLTRIIHN